MEKVESLPHRNGPRPTTIPCAPHSQTDQIPENSKELSAALVERIEALAGVYKSSSMRAPPGTVGFYIHKNAACPNPECFLLGNEFAHVHVEDDGSLHVILPEPQRKVAIDAGWAETHPLAGQPTVSPFTVMLYAPRNLHEVDTIARLVEISWRNGLMIPNI